MLFIFDWDGTLIDSKAMITPSMHCAVADMGWEQLPDAQIHNIIGLGLPQAIKTLFPQATASDQLLIRNAYAQHFIRIDQENAAEFFPDVKATLDQLKRDGHTLSIATGKSRKGLDRILKNMALTDYFAATQCADETASKPDPKMLHELLAYFDVKADQSVMLGDTEYDMAMAKAINMPRIAVSYGAHHIDRLLPYQPELALDYFGDLLKWQGLQTFSLT